MFVWIFLDLNFLSPNFPAIFHSCCSCKVSQRQSTAGCLTVATVCAQRETTDLAVASSPPCSAIHLSPFVSLGYVLSFSRWATNSVCSVAHSPGSTGHHSIIQFKRQVCDDAFWEGPVRFLSWPTCSAGQLLVWTVKNLTGQLCQRLFKTF